MDMGRKILKLKTSFLSAVRHCLAVATEINRILDTEGATVVLQL